MSKDSEIAIKVENLHKSFSFAHEKSASLKSKFVKPFKKNKKDVQKVLNGVSFEIKKGEFFGIVGRNGSGKSTLLKLLAGIYTPDKGSVQVNGKLVPFIELGVGFNPELSGRDNVFLNGALLGFNRKEMSAMYEEIVEFAELHDHMDKKLKNYSSGMQVRLAFSIAIRARGDILVLDEVLAVGDESFQRKCYSYFDELRQKQKTVILVTHSMDSVKKYCTKALLIDKREIRAIGNPVEIADEYYKLNFSGSTIVGFKKNRHRITSKIIGGRMLSPSDSLCVEIFYKSNSTSKIFPKAFVDYGGHPIMSTNPKLLGWDKLITSDTKEHKAIYKLALDSFNAGEYRLITLLEDFDSGVTVAGFGYNGELTFSVVNPKKSSSAGLLINKAIISTD